MDRLLFPDLLPVPLEGQPAPPADGKPLLAPVDDRQLRLFSDLVVLRRDLEQAVAVGDFNQATSVRQLVLDSFGPGGLGQDLAFLERLGPDLWERPTQVVLERWQEIDRSLADRPLFRTGVRNGVFRELLRRHGAAALAVERPDLVGPVCAALISLDTAFGHSSARALIRDVLLAACGIDAGQLAHDRAVADLLAEHLSPVWLACLGALRRLWAIPPLGPAELASFASEPPLSPSSDEAAAREFWTCLRVVRTPETPEALLHEARRRMKRLNPEMHALLMGRAWPSSGAAAAPEEHP